MIRNTENNLLKIENFLTEKDEINIHDEKFLKLMFLYSLAIKEIENKINIIKEEFKYFYHYDLIKHTTARLKEPESIIQKMKDKKYEPTYENLIKKVNDIAGVRIICSLKSDIFVLKKIIESFPNYRILKEKDYVTKPKKSGYSSYHIIIEVPVNLAEQIIFVKVEIQIRTMAMDIWANIEHDTRYKCKDKVKNSINKELISCAKIVRNLDDKLVKISC